MNVHLHTLPSKIIIKVGRLAGWQGDTMADTMAVPMEPPQSVPKPPSTDYQEYRLFCRTVQSTALRGLFEVLCHIIHDSNLVWDTHGASLMTMDSARCAIIHLDLTADRFDEYHCLSQLTMGVNMASVFKLLKTVSTSDTITMFSKKVSTHELGIVIENAERNTCTSYTLKLLDCDSEDIMVPDVVFDRVVCLPSVYLQRTCREMQNLGDYITIKTDGNNLKLICEGSIATQETCIGESDACLNILETTGETVEGLFSLRYLTLFTRASGLCATVNVHLKSQFPLVLMYNVANLGYLKFCLAARVE
jgi:proliferating cell nuclear antigen